jgi:hypothetical protein
MTSTGSSSTGSSSTAVPMDPDVSRRTWLTLEPFHAMIYFAPEAQEEYAAIGLDSAKNRAVGYFPARSAAMGAVSVDVVQATFFNFSRLAVEFGITGVWDKVTPQQVLDARNRGAQRALRRLCSDALDTPEVLEAVELGKQAVTGLHLEGRPLYAAHAGLAWPTEPGLALWHAVMLMREFRGDGHIAALVAEGFTGLDAAVTHVAQGGPWTKEALRDTRAYSPQEWDDCVADLVARGIMTPDEKLTSDGAAWRDRAERMTDQLALPLWQGIGADGADRLCALVRPLRDLVVAGGGFPLSSR